MKALITIIDDDGKVLRSNKLISPMRTKSNGMADIYEFSFQFIQASFDCLFSNGNVYIVEGNEEEEKK